MPFLNDEQEVFAETKRHILSVRMLLLEGNSPSVLKNDSYDRHTAALEHQNPGV